MYRILKQEGNAKRAEFETVHGTIQTPVFMNVGTVAAIKGAVSTEDLEQINPDVHLSPESQPSGKPAHTLPPLTFPYGYSSWLSVQTTLPKDPGTIEAGTRIYDEVNGYEEATFEDDWKLILINKENPQNTHRITSRIRKACHHCKRKQNRNYGYNSSPVFKNQRIRKCIKGFGFNER